MDLDHCEPLAEELKAVREIKAKIEEMALERAKFEGIDKDPRM